MGDAHQQLYKELHPQTSNSSFKFVWVRSTICLFYFCKYDFLTDTSYIKLDHKYRWRVVDTRISPSLTGGKTGFQAPDIGSQQVTDLLDTEWITIELPEDNRMDV